MDARWRIDLLGGLRAEGCDRVITRFRTQKTGGLLAYLAYSMERRHPREELTELLWPESDLSAGRQSLNQALYVLRRQLEPPGVPSGAVIVADRFSVQLNPAACATDVAEFEAALQAASRASSRAEEVERLTEAVALYRGELLPGHFEDWVLQERERLAEAFHQALDPLIAHEWQAGHLPGALQWARRAVSADPLREEAHRELIRLLAAAGQPAAALRQYRELERLLKEKLAAEPEAATRALVRELERADTPSQPPPVILPGRDGWLPVAEGVASPSVAATATAPLPTGTVTFLLTDVEGHTALWERTGDVFPAALASHRDLLRHRFREHSGYEVKELGDGFLVAFPRAADALACALASQQALMAHPWPQAVGALPVRMALHTGDVQPEQGDYHHLTVNHAQRMLVTGHGGQILCSEATAALLRRELEPGVGLVDLGVYRLRDVAAPERLFQVDYPDMPRREFPPLKTEAGYVSHLPLSFTRFFGREEEIHQLRDLLLPAEEGRPGDPARGRLVTLTGPGGTGKTRLGLAVAAQVQEAFHGAIWFVALADLTDPQLIVDQTMSALRLPRSPGAEPLEQVVAALTRQPALLLLDNFEHLAAEGATLVRTLLERVATLTVLVTSRQRLNLPGEREFPVPTLPTPTNTDTLEELSRCESVRLFIDRAQAVRPDFQVTVRNAAAVAALCERLEGIPLALELAAARVSVLTPAQMLAHLERRFDFLVSRSSHTTPRHRTLRGTIDWSYELLSPELQQFFACLSVFRGGWTLEAAEAVCEQPLALDQLEQLRECSLVLAEDASGETRFRLLETLREYGLECLAASGEAERAWRRHAEFFLALTEAAEPGLKGPDQVVWLDRLEREHDNLRAALTCSIEKGEAELSLRLGEALWRYWQVRGYFAEGRERLAAVLALAGASEFKAARAEVLHGAGLLAYDQSDYSNARTVNEEALIIRRQLGDQRGIAASLNNLGHVARLQGDYALARALYEESLAIGRDLGDKQGLTVSLNGLGLVHCHQGDCAAARPRLEESLAIGRELGDKRRISISLKNLGLLAQEEGDYSLASALLEESLVIAQELSDRLGMARSLHNLGTVALRRGDYTAARALLGESLVIQREHGDRHGMAWSLHDLGEVTWAQGDYRTARSLFMESLAVRHELGDKPGIVECLGGLAGVTATQDQPEWAARLLGAAAALRQAVGIPFPTYAQAEYDQGVAAARAALGDEVFAAAWAEGRAMTLDQAVAYAMKHDALA
jgi:predicted ATPase/DNA-binding SARP family transcriptional activator/class 3 adenylate cyclase